MRMFLEVFTAVLLASTLGSVISYLVIRTLIFMDPKVRALLRLLREKGIYKEERRTD
jgi:uncharacterized membrane protein YqgA involved in biofilm formation